MPLKKRLIPVLLLKNGQLVRSEAFRVHQVIGLPIHEVARFNEWNVDELVYLDITRDDTYDVGRDDHKVKDLRDRLDILDAISRTCFMPLTFGGRLRTLDDVRDVIRRGADKVSLCTGAVRTPQLVADAARVFGSQAVVVCIDALRVGDGWDVRIDGGQTSAGLDPVAWAREAERLGAGEILLQSVDRDGTGRGYDVDLVRAVANAVGIPVIALGGVGRYEDYAAGVRAGASAVAAANIFHFKELSDRNGKRALQRAGIPVRL